MNYRASFFVLCLTVIPFFSASASVYDEDSSYNQALAERLHGQILLQVDEHGEAWYIRSSDSLRYYMKDGDVAYEMMRFFSLGITDVDLARIDEVADTTEMNASSSACASNSLANRLAGEILLQVEQNGEAWYVDPEKCRRIYMEDGSAAYEIMRFLGLGITNTDLEKIAVGELEAGEVVVEVEDGDTESPTLTVAQTNKELGGGMWLFVVDDNQNQLAVSSESNQSVRMGRLDLNNLNEEIDWEVVADSSDTGGIGIADHWHIYAHGYHWIVFSVSGANQSYLLQLDKNFNRVSLQALEPENNMPTNDMFMVEEPDGIAIGHFLPGVGHQIYRYDSEGNFRETFAFGGGAFGHGNGASAVMTDTGWIIYAPEHLSPYDEGAIYKITVDENWNPVSRTALFQEDGYMLAMPTVVELESGYRIGNYRRLAVLDQNVSLELIDDSGSLVQFVTDANGELVTEEIFVEEDGNRPHSTLVNSQLITTWDSDGSIYVRVQEID